MNKTMMFLRRWALGLFLALILGPVEAQPLTLPIAVADAQWAPLGRMVDPKLQAMLDQRLRRRPEWRELLEQRRMAVGLVDLSRPERPLFARVNGNVEMYAASLPKIAILLAAYDQLDRGRLKRSKDIDADLTAMIRHSDNGAATRMIDRLGGLTRVNEVLRDPRYRFYDENGNGGLWVGKRYAKTGPRLPDPLKGISHAATVNQVCRFYYQLATGRLIDFDTSREMLGHLANPALGHKFVNSLRKLAPDANLYRKSGTWKHWHADSVLVWGQEGWRRYILVALVDSNRGEQIMRDLVGVAESLLRLHRSGDFEEQFRLAKAHDPIGNRAKPALKRTPASAHAPSEGP